MVGAEICYLMSALFVLTGSGYLSRGISLTFLSSSDSGLFSLVYEYTSLSLPANKHHVVERFLHYIHWFQGNGEYATHAQRHRKKRAGKPYDHLKELISIKQSNRLHHMTSSTMVWKMGCRELRVTGVWSMTRPGPWSFWQCNMASMVIDS